MSINVFNTSFKAFIMMLRAANNLGKKISTLKFTRNPYLQVAFASTNLSSAEEYSNRNAQIQGTYFQRLISKIKIKEGWKCLDLGCGPGNNTYTLSKIVAEKGDVLGIDPDKQRIEVAEKMFFAPNINYVCGRSTNFPMYDEGYDLVMSNLVMHWINYKERIETYRRVSQALKSGGLCGITEICTLPYNVLALLDYMPVNERNFITGNSHFYTIEENKKMFTEAGLEVIHTEHMITHDATHCEVNHFLDWLTETYHGNIDAQAAYKKGLIKLERNEEGLITYPCDLNIIVARKP